MGIIVPGAIFLGGTTPLGADATTTGVVIFGPGYGKIFIYHFIWGYSASTVAVLRFGAGTTVDTGANYSHAGYHVTMGTAAITATPTATASTTGIRVANDATANGRRGIHEVWNSNFDATFVDSRTATFSTTNPSTAAATQSTMSFMTGHWWNNAQAQCVDMAVPTGNLKAGSYITVYGIPGQG